MGHGGGRRRVWRSGGHRGVGDLKRMAEGLLERRVGLAVPFELEENLGHEHVAPGVARVHGDGVGQRRLRALEVLQQGRVNTVLWQFFTGLFWQVRGSLGGFRALLPHRAEVARLRDQQLHVEDPRARAHHGPQHFERFSHQRLGGLARGGRFRPARVRGRGL